MSEELKIAYINGFPESYGCLESGKCHRPGLGVEALRLFARLANISKLDFIEVGDFGYIDGPINGEKF